MDLCQEKCIHRDRVTEAADSLPPAWIARQLADLFKAMGDPTRLKILTALLTGELCVCDLAAVCGLSDSAVSHQLRTLRAMGMLDNRREGKIVYYRLADDHVRRILENSLRHLEHQDTASVAG